jgi:hypothetical protein
MNKVLARIFMPYLSNLFFADLVGGYAQTITVGSKAEGSKLVKKFPATMDVALPRKLESGYQDLTPNTMYNSIMFFQGNDSRLLDKQRGNFNMKTTLRIVGWLNAKSAMTSDTQAIVAILGALPEKEFNSPENGLIRIHITSTRIVDNDIFSRYTFEEQSRQYLMFPFQAFCLELEINFSITTSTQCSS